MIVSAGRRGKTKVDDTACRVMPLNRSCHAGGSLHGTTQKPDARKNEGHENINQDSPDTHRRTRFRVRTTRSFFRLERRLV
jgi:hypothetical protein